MANYNSNIQFQLLANAQQFNSELKRARGEFASFTRGINKVAGLAAGGFLVGEFAQVTKEIIGTRTEYSKLEKVLANTLGSDSAAAVELQRLSQFARENNQETLKLTQSYVNLTNRGLQPSQKELKSLLDLAGATGKSFDQVAEAVLDAVVGENERLKELGIRAKDAGDTVKFSFRGITTEVEKNEQAIKDYIFSLGELKGVAGAAKAASTGIDGFNNSVSELRNEIGKLAGNEGSKLLSFFTDGIYAASDFIKLIRQLESKPITINAGGDQVGGSLLNNIDDLVERLNQVRTNLSGPLLPFEGSKLREQEAEILRLIEEQSKEYSKQVQIDIERDKLNAKQIERQKAEEVAAKELEKRKQALLTLEKQRLSVMEQIAIQTDIQSSKLPDYTLTPTEALGIGRNPYFSDEFTEQMRDSIAEAEKYREVVADLPDSIREAGNAFTDAAGGLDIFSTTLANSLANGEKVFESFKRAAVASLSEITAALIKQAILSALVTTILPGFGAFKLAGALGAIGSKGAFGSLFKFSVPQLANGGIVSKDGLYRMGEGNKKEAVIPLDRINQYMKPTAGGDSFTVTQEWNWDKVLFHIKRIEDRRKRLS
ncbi:hypothetical protein WJR50_11490 [Catalinimonas sp. 4WD22]|uniref:hypothetical protein n=1 Tax=Catalinimonas locisalis TaxID=3133978 RepID=UPI0031019B4F